MMFDTKKLQNRITEIKYPYFDKDPDVEDSIGGYACDTKYGVQTFFWMYTVSDIINALTSAGLRIEYFNEYKENFFNAGGLEYVGDGLFNYDYNANKFPMSFSLKAVVL